MSEEHEDHMHIEELKAEVRRLQGEVISVEDQADREAGRWHKANERIAELEAERRALRRKVDEWCRSRGSYSSSRATLRQLRDILNAHGIKKPAS